MGLLGTLLGCAPERPARAEEPPPTVTLYGMRITSFRGEEVVAAGRAAKLTYVRNGSDFEAQGVQLRFPSARGLGVGSGLISGGLEVAAPNVVGNQNQRVAEGRGGVVMRSGDGVVARSEKVLFNGVDRTARGDSRVDVTGPTYALSSDRFALDFATERYEFEGRVDSRLGTAGP